MDRYDHIVVGGGSAGCIVAAELAADPARRVLLIEGGPRAEEHPETLDAGGYKYAFVNDAVMCERFTVPQQHSARQRLFAGTGTVMGGSGSVNGMVYTRGAREDYDEWPAGWRWDDVEADFRAVEARIRPHTRPPTDWTEACIASAEAHGFTRKADLNDGDLSNVIGYEWMSYEGDERRSSYVAFLKEPGVPPNLEIRTGARVHRIRFDADRRARGVDYERDGRLERADASGEIVLTAGALETPRLLLLSGVGPAEQLRSVGIAPVAERDAIGRGLHDHPNVPVFFKTKRDIDCFFPQLYSFFRTRPDSDLPPGQSDTCYVYWPAPSAMKQMMQRMLPPMVVPRPLYGPRSRAAVRRMLDGAFRIDAVQRFTDHVFGIVLILGKPKSRGSLRLASADPREPARIDPGYYSAAEDMETMVRGVRIARRIGGSAPLADFGARELMPGKRVESDAALARYVRRNTITTYHFAGTCAMGTSEAHAVDPELRVRGVSHLRVADASAIPWTPVSALNAPSMMIGYRAARWVRDASSAPA